jgi:hypothetical protein
MIVFPLILFYLELHHPVGFSKNVYDGLIGVSDHWFYLHIFQSILFGGVAVGAILLTHHNNNFWGLISKLFIWIFAIAYIVFDSTAGISVGFILDATKHHPDYDVNTIRGVVQLLYSDYLIGGSNSIFSLTGSWAWLLGIISAIIAIGLKYKNLPIWKLAPPFLLLLISAYTLYVGHYPPYGPIAFACFALASIWFEIFKFGPASSKNSTV